jgi:hypothetical protein
MPMEVQLMIANCVDEKDVLTLNSTCRALSSLVQPVMASTFSSDRTFDFSDEGMAALPALSERITWAPYLKTLIIVHNGTTKSIGCHQVLATALKNFGAFGKLTSLGVRHGGYQGDFEHHKLRAYVCIRGFLENILASAMTAELPIRNVIFDIGIPQTSMTATFSDVPGFTVLWHRSDLCSKSTRSLPSWTRSMQCLFLRSIAASGSARWASKVQ